MASTFYPIIKSLNEFMNKIAIIKWVRIVFITLSIILLLTSFRRKKFEKIETT